MTTKTEYREYISSEAWRHRRSLFLDKMGADCWRCHIPRWLVNYVYDQDIHVHHKSYARVGAESDADLEPLCPRCHELETFGKTDKRLIKALDCSSCGCSMWVPSISSLCPECNLIQNGPSDHIISTPINNRGATWGEKAIWFIANVIGQDLVLHSLAGFEAFINRTEQTSSGD